mgnify:CR=1 FL=1
MDQALLGSLVTSAFALAGLIVSRIKCKDGRDEDGACNPMCACQNAPLDDHHELEIERLELDNMEVAIITKKNR